MKSNIYKPCTDCAHYVRRSIQGIELSPECTSPKLNGDSIPVMYIRGNAVMGRCNNIGNWFEQKPIEDVPIMTEHSNGTLGLVGLVDKIKSIFNRVFIWIKS